MQARPRAGAPRARQILPISLDISRIYGKIASMRGVGRIIPVAMSVAIGLGVVCAPALADDAQKPAAAAAPAKQPARPAPSQTASIGDASAPVSPVLNLNIAPLSFTTDKGSLTQAERLDPSQAPQPYENMPGQHQGARFVPMLRQTETADDPQNRDRSFVDNHEFGIQLKSEF